jgi:hypothetical protein
MGKKRRMMAKPQKFGTKFANHPRMAERSNQQAIEEMPPVVEEIETPVLDVVEEEIAPKPKPKAKPKAKAAPKRKATTARAKKTTSKK